MSAVDHAEEFRRFIVGLCATDPGPIVADGKWHRFRIADTRHKGSMPGRYLLHVDGKANGIFMDWRNGTQHKWFAGGAPIHVDREQIERQREERRRNAEAGFARAGQAALEFWRSCTKINGASHGYLDRKGIAPHGARYGSGRPFGLGDAQCVIIPLIGPEGQPLSLQAIRADGERRYWPGSTKEAAHYLIGSDAGERPIVLCEGFATGATIHEATGHPVVVCFDAGSLVPVARWAGHRWHGRDFIVAGDDDVHLAEQGKANKGREAAEAAARILGARVIYPDLQGAEGSDFNDQAAHFGIEDVAKLFAAPLPPPREREPSKSSEARPPAATEPRERLKATPYIWQDPETIEPRDWLLGRMLLRGQAHGKMAPGGYGKTFHTVATALSLVTGRPLLGHEVWGGPKKVWIWNLEDPSIELTRAIQAACKHWGIKREDIEGRLFVDCAMDGAELKIATATLANGVVINRPLVEDLVEELIDRGIDYLDVDPFVSSHGVDENDNVQIDAVTKEWARVAARSGTAIGITHHIKKLNGGEVTAEMARGAVSFVAALRSAFVINRMTPDDAATWGIPNEQRRRYIRVYDDKGNRAPPADKSDWYYLASVDLCNGPSDGSRPSDNIAALEPWQPPNAFTGITTDHLRRVQEALMQGEWREDIQSPQWAGHAVGPIVGRQSDKGEEHKADRTVIRKLLQTWVANGALIVTTRDDNKGVRRKWIEVGEPVCD